MLYSEPIPLAIAVVSASACLVLALMGWRAWRRGPRPASAGKAPSSQKAEGEALLTRYQPSAVRVLTASELQAFDMVREALPTHLVMAQVPLVRYLRVEDKRAEDDWLRGLSMLSADILVCDSTSRPVLAIDILTPKPGNRSRERHERMRQLLEGVGIRVLVWREGRIPTAEQARTALQHAIQLGGNSARATQAAAKNGLTPKRAATPAADARARIEPELGAIEPALARGATATAHGAMPGRAAAMPLIPVAEITEVLAEGDEITGQPSRLDPVSLTFFDEFDARPQGPGAPMH